VSDKSVAGNKYRLGGHLLYSREEEKKEEDEDV
jgi:hypothetical protein